MRCFSSWSELGRRLVGSPPGADGQRLGHASQTTSCCTWRWLLSQRATFYSTSGDYVRLLALRNDFYGVFSGSNLPDRANLPNGVIYQHNANWTTHTLLGTNNTTPVPISIDPFFVHYRRQGRR